MLSSFKSTENDTSAIGEVCRHLDGIPLAIELPKREEVKRYFKKDVSAERLQRTFSVKREKLAEAQEIDRRGLLCQRLKVLQRCRR